MLIPETYSTRCRSTSFPSEVREKVLDNLQLKTKTQNLEQWWRWLLNISKGKKSEAVMRRRIFAFFVAEIWRVGNARVFKGESIDVQKAAEGSAGVKTSDTNAEPVLKVHPIAAFLVLK
ncbi:hypothetical protein AKJ16_DCAP04909 [Drosera capensis]